MKRSLVLVGVLALAPLLAGCFAPGPPRPIVPSVICTLAFLPNSGHTAETVYVNGLVSGVTSGTAVTVSWQDGHGGGQEAETITGPTFHYTFQEPLPSTLTQVQVAETSGPVLCTVTIPAS